MYKVGYKISMLVPDRGIGSPAMLEALKASFLGCAAALSVRM
jgi:hypothetical protein